MLDEQAIVGVTYRYCAAIDARSWDDLTHCFTPDAAAVFGGLPGRHEGLAEIQRVIRSALEPLDASQHIVSNHLIEVSGDTATSRCYVQAQHVRSGPDGSDNFTLAGTYEDEWQRTGDGWRICSRTLSVTWTQGNREVLAKRASGDAPGGAGAPGEPR
jgi:ketosteroid isomerase-like protein